MTGLLYPIIIPIITGFLVLLVPSALKRVRELIALIGTAITVYYAGAIFFVHKGVSFSQEWFSLGNFLFSFDFKADSLNGFILFIASIFALLIIIYSIGYMKNSDRHREYYTYILWTSGAAALALLADNLLILLIGWEITTMLTFFLITMGGKDSGEAAGKTFVIIGFSDCALVLGTLMIWYWFGTFRISYFNAVPVSSGYVTAIYILFLIGALVKAGAMPGHSWVPQAASKGPVSVIAFLPASLDKLLGIYLLARISLFMFSLSEPLKLLLLIIGAVTIMLAVMMALIQHNLKKLLAFHAVSQVGYMVLGIGTGVPAGVVGGLFHMVNNAIYKCCLFLGAGAVEKRTGTTELEELGGLAKAMPVTFYAMLISSLAISGVPPLNGFASKWLIYQGTIEAGRPVFLLAAMFGSALTLASFFKVIHSVFLGKRPAKLNNVKPAGWAMAIPMIFLAFVCVIFGVFAQIPLRYLIGPAVGVNIGPVPDMIVTARGLWSPTLATALIIVSLFVGLIFYYLGNVVKLRKTSIFVGGEILDSDEIRYPGTGFYETIRTLTPLKTLYKDAESGVFDLYVLGGRYGMKLVGVLQSIHNGIISTYLAFALLGLTFLIFFLVR